MEIAGVATLPAMRRRGVASCLVSFLVGEHFKSGDLVFASAGSVAAWELLAKRGFRDGGLGMRYVKPS